LSSLIVLTKKSALVKNSTAEYHVLWYIKYSTRFQRGSALDCAREGWWRDVSASMHLCAGIVHHTSFYIHLVSLAPWYISWEHFGDEYHRCLLYVTISWNATTCIDWMLLLVRCNLLNHRDVSICHDSFARETRAPY